MLDRQNFRLPLQLTLPQKSVRIPHHRCCGASRTSSVKRFPKLLGCLRLLRRRASKDEIVWQQYHFCIDVVEHQILGGKPHHFGTRIRKDLVVEKSAISRETVSLPMDPPSWRETQVDFSISAIVLRLLEFILASREQVAPTDWQVRTLLADCRSRAKMNPTPLSRHRQHALIIVFLELSVKAALATNWIKDQPARVHASEPCASHEDGPIYKQFTRKSNGRRQLRNPQMRILAFRETIDPSRESIGNCTEVFSPYMAVLRRHLLIKNGFPVLYVTSLDPKLRF